MDLTGRPSGSFWMRVLPVAALLLICVLFYWKLALTDQYVWFDHPDMCYIELPRLQMQAHEIHQGRFPLWDPYIWMGQPLIGQTQPGPLFPLNLLFYLLPLKDGYIRFAYLNWYFVVIHMIAAVGAYLLCRDLGRSRFASVLAGCAFAFAGFLGTVAWLDVMNGAIWTPFICMFFLRAMRGVRTLSSVALCGLFLGFAWLSGHHEIPMLVSYALGAGWLYAIWRRRTRVLVPGLLIFAIGALIAAVQLWPTAEFARLSERWVGLDRSIGWEEKIPYTAPTTYSMSPKGLVATALYDASSYADSAPFLGIVVVALAAYGICTGWRIAPVRWISALTVGATLFALGAFTPLHGWLFSFAPLLGKARVPVRAIHLMNFGLVVLAAYGMDRLLARGEVKWARRFVTVLVGLAVVIFSAYLWQIPILETVLWGATIALGVAALFAASSHGRISRAACGAGLLSLMLLELYPVSSSKLSSRHDKEAFKFVRSLTDNKDVVDFLRKEPFPLRLVVNDQDIPTNFGDWHAFNTVEGYVAGVSSNLLRYGRHTQPVQDLFGVTHYLSRQADKPGLIDVFTGSTGVKVFRNPDAFPRAWSVHQTEQVKEGWRIAARVEQPGFDARRTAVMLGVDAPPLEQCEGDQVKLVTYAPNRIRLRASMKCRGMVVLSETYFPGWTAAVDGRQTPIVEVYGALRGVVVAGGDHSIEMAYRPASVYGGGMLTFSGFAAVILLIGVEAVRRKRRRLHGARKPVAHAVAPR